ncbi:MAG: hypothetical protein CEO12_365 [Parcubacteria group bacterium Gr01-1014_46]|nr:MAG: hypothetical protein CEO12_365 [Parcubacteria group bacterium Gr01-1014_46]
MYYVRRRKAQMRYVVLAIIMATVACSDFTDEKAKFEAFNNTVNRIAVSVDGREYNVGPKGNVNFTVPIMVPKPADLGYNYLTAPSEDRKVQISVRVVDHDAGTVTSPKTCEAGAKTTTRITYFGGSQFQCETLNTPSPY